MRLANFRDDLLWNLAYRIGLDPTKELLTDQADALATYINAWVRRTYDATDYPEWTAITNFQPDPTTHVVPWMEFNLDGTIKLSIGRVFKVYLADPNTTWLPIDTPFRLLADGIHCGFEHGQTVWIKYIAACPRFTAKVWDPTVSYSLGDIVYSPVTGDCFRSKVNLNLGHDPSIAPIPIPPTILQPAVAATPGTTGQTGQRFLGLQTLGGSTTAPIADPPPATSVFTANVFDSTGALLGTASETANGIDSLINIASQLAIDLAAIPALHTMTFTATTLTVGAAPVPGVQVEDASNFSLSGTYAPPSVSTGPSAYALTETLVRAYLPAVPPTAGQPQIARLAITTDQVKNGTTFNVSFLDALGLSHLISYTATVTDAPLQVLTGLQVSLARLAGTDPVAGVITCTIDPVANTITFSSPKELGVAANLDPAASLYWDLVQFPLALVEQVVRGAYSDALREQGQAEKAATEEQAVGQEKGIRENTQTTQQYQPLTDQQAPKSRYAVK